MGDKRIGKGIETIAKNWLTFQDFMDTGNS